MLGAFEVREVRVVGRKQIRDFGPFSVSPLFFSVELQSGWGDRPTGLGPRKVETP